MGKRESMFGRRSLALVAGLTVLGGNLVSGQEVPVLPKELQCVHFVRLGRQPYYLTVEQITKDRIQVMHRRDLELDESDKFRCRLGDLDAYEVKRIGMKEVVVRRLSDGQDFTLPVTISPKPIPAEH